MYRARSRVLAALAGLYLALLCHHALAHSLNASTSSPGKEFRRCCEKKLAGRNTSFLCDYDPTALERGDGKGVPSVFENRLRDLRNSSLTTSEDDYFYCMVGGDEVNATTAMECCEALISRWVTFRDFYTGGQKANISPSFSVDDAYKCSRDVCKIIGSSPDAEKWVRKWSRALDSCPLEAKVDIPRCMWGKAGNSTANNRTKPGDTGLTRAAIVAIIASAVAGTLLVGAGVGITCHVLDKRRWVVRGSGDGEGQVGVYLPTGNSNCLLLAGRRGRRPVPRSR